MGMASSWCLGFFLVLVVLFHGASAAGYSSAPAGFQPTPWQQAHATFYGDETASETNGELIYSQIYALLLSNLIDKGKIIMF